jgi:hypothetical protein
MSKTSKSVSGKKTKSGKNGTKKSTLPVPNIVKKTASKTKKKNQPSKKPKQSGSKKKTSGDHRILMQVGKSLSSLGTKIAVHLKK